MTPAVNTLGQQSNGFSHIPLVKPVEWCFRQIKNIGNLNDAAGSTRCARVASKICLVFLAFVTLIPNLILAGVGLAFSCIFKKRNVLPAPVPTQNQPPAISLPTPIPQPKPITQPSKQTPKKSSKTKQPTQSKPTIITPNKPSSTTPSPLKKAATLLNLTEFNDKDLQFYSSTHTPEEVLLNKAIEFFASKGVKARKSLQLDYSHLGPQATDHQIIDEILKKHQGFNVGESHNHLSSKRFFLENMAYLKSKNVKTIFFEGADFRDQNAMDQYLSGVWDENQADIKKLKEKILDYSRGFGVPDHLSDWEVLKAAKKHGIHVSFIDYGREVSGPARLLRMNYVAAKVMARDLQKFGPNDKFVGYVGWNHIAKVNSDPNFGLSELFQCPAVIVRDNSTTNQRNVVYKKIPSDNFVGNIHVVIFAKKL